MRRLMLAGLAAAILCGASAAYAGETKYLPVKGLNERLDEIVVKQDEKAKLVDEANKR